MPETLCTRCGLCCDGSLFADVELTPRETAALEIMGLSIDDSENLLLQPCAALKNKRCSIYQYRPKCCRTFECKLLQQVKRGDITYDYARAQVSKTLTLLRRNPRAAQASIQKNFLPEFSTNKSF